MPLKVFIYSEMRVGNLLNKSNAPYLIAGTFATLALTASGTLAIAPYVVFLSSVAAFNIALPVALSVSILSALVLALSCKMISKNRKIEAERSKFAEKEGELANQITLEKETREATDKQAEELNNRLNEAIQEKQDANGRIEELGKKFSDQITKLSKDLGSAATKGEVEELSKEFSGFKTKLDEISRQTNDAATKGEVEELSKKFSDQITKLSKDLGSAATKGEVEELSKKFSDITKLIDTAATKGEVEELNKKVNSQQDEIINLKNSAATESKTKGRVFMKLCAKDKKRGEKAFESFIFAKERKQELVNICELIKKNINIVSSAESGDSKEKQKKLKEIDRGFIFYGPGGTGKSSIVEAIGDQLISLTTFIKVPGADLLEKSNVGELFNKAEENAPCIVLIDEIDSIGMERTTRNRESLNYFFTRFDEARKDVTVFATTNVSPKDLDESLIRGGRLSRKLKFTKMEGDTLRNILRDSLNERLKDEKHKHIISKILEEIRESSLSAANLESFVNYAVERVSKADNKTSNASTIVKGFCSEYNIRRASDKQYTNNEAEGKERLKRSQSCANINLLANATTFSESRIPVAPSFKKQEKAPVQKSTGLPTTVESIETSEEENKENSGPQINKGPDTSVKSPGSSPLKDTTNIVSLNACTGGA